MNLSNFLALPIGTHVYYAIGERTCEGTVSAGGCIDWEDGVTQYPTDSLQTKYIWTFE